MQIVSNSQPTPVSAPEAECRFDGSSTQRTKTGYAERRDLQHALIWDQEPARMTFAEMASAEETALSRLFEQATIHAGKTPETLPLPLSAAVSQELIERKLVCPDLDFSPRLPLVFSPPPLVAPAEPFAIPDELVGLETLAHVPSYEQLLRTTSYNIIESHCISLKDIPVSPGKCFDASLPVLVDAADRARNKGSTQSSRLPHLRCQAYLLMGSQSVSPARQSGFSKLRALDVHSTCRTNWSFGCIDPRDVMQGIWNRFVAKKNASLMLAVMQRKMRIR